jgi:hypothetical protein
MPLVVGWVKALPQSRRIPYGDDPLDEGYSCLPQSGAIIFLSTVPADGSISLEGTWRQTDLGEVSVLGTRAPW